VLEDESHSVLDAPAAHEHKLVAVLDALEEPREAASAVEEGDREESDILLNLRVHHGGHDGRERQALAKRHANRSNHGRR
jgi:hypothetical protein